MNQELIDLLTSQHKENMQTARESIRLLELLAAEQKVSNVRCAMLDETIKKTLIAITDFGGTAKELLEQFSDIK